MSDEKMKELSLDDMNDISGGVGFDAPWEFLDSIPDEKLRKAWAVAFCIPQNFSSWNEFDSYFAKPNFASAWMEAGGVTGISEKEFKNICRQAIKIQQGKMDYPTF